MAKRDKEEPFADFGASVDPGPAPPLPAGLTEKLRDLAADGSPDRHNRACDLLLEFIGSGEVTQAFNAIPRHL